jgi:hypothetical protein
MQAATIPAMHPGAAPTTAPVLVRIVREESQFLRPGSDGLADAGGIAALRGRFSGRRQSHCVEGNLAAMTHLTSLERVREETNGWDCRAIASASAAQPEEI